MLDQCRPIRSARIPKGLLARRSLHQSEQDPAGRWTKDGPGAQRRSRTITTRISRWSDLSRTGEIEVMPDVSRGRTCGRHLPCDSRRKSMAIPERFHVKHGRGIARGRHNMLGSRSFCYDPEE